MMLQSRCCREVRDDQSAEAVLQTPWWAGALDQNMTLLVSIQLAQQLQSNRIVTSPWPTYRKNDYQVTILVGRFDGELGGEVVLNGLWNILDGEGEKSLDKQLFEFKTNTTDSTYQVTFSNNF